MGHGVVKHYSDMKPILELSPNDFRVESKTRVVTPQQVEFVAKFIVENATHNEERDQEKLQKEVMRHRTRFDQLVNAAIVAHKLKQYDNFMEFADELKTLVEDHPSYLDPIKLCGLYALTEGKIGIFVLRDEVKREKKFTQPMPIPLLKKFHLREKSAL